MTGGAAASLSTAGPLIVMGLAQLASKACLKQTIGEPANLRRLTVLSAHHFDTTAYGGCRQREPKMGGGGAGVLRMETKRPAEDGQ